MSIWLFFSSILSLKVCPRHYFEEKNELCKSCDAAITDTYVAACGGKFHEQHWRCHGSCEQSFKDDSSYFDMGGLPFCADCKAYAEGKVCFRCKRGVADGGRTEMDKLWHENCFQCGKCAKAFGAGEAFEENLSAPYHKDCLKALEDSSSPSGGSYAKPASQSAASRAMALKRRSKQRVRPRTSTGGEASAETKE